MFGPGVMIDRREEPGVRPCRGQPTGGARLRREFGVPGRRSRGAHHTAAHALPDACAPEREDGARQLAHAEALGRFSVLAASRSKSGRCASTLLVPSML